MLFIELTAPRIYLSRSRSLSRQPANPLDNDGCSAINAGWFAKDALKTDSDPRIRRMVILSALWALAWLVGLIIWVSYYQKNR